MPVLEDAPIWGLDDNADALGISLRAQPIFPFRSSLLAAQRYDGIYLCGAPRGNEAGDDR
jgi:hypothetical protein